MKLRHRHIEQRIVGIDQVQEFGQAVTEVEIDQPLVATDSVVGMDNRVAAFEFGQVTDNRVDIGGGLTTAPAGPPRGAGEQFVLGDDGGIGVASDEAVVQRSGYQCGGQIAVDPGRPVRNDG